MSAKITLSRDASGSWSSLVELGSATMSGPSNPDLKIASAEAGRLLIEMDRQAVSARHHEAKVARMAANG